MLGVVLALIWFSARAAAQRGWGRGRGRHLRVLEALAVGRERNLLLIELAGKVYLVGSTGDQFSLLDRIEEPERLEAILTTEPGQPGSGAGAPLAFAHLLARARHLSRAPSR